MKKGWRALLSCPHRVSRLRRLGCLLFSVGKLIINPDNLLSYLISHKMKKKPETQSQNYLRKCLENVLKQELSSLETFLKDTSELPDGTAHKHWLADWTSFLLQSATKNIQAFEYPGSHIDTVQTFLEYFQLPMIDSGEIQPITKVVSGLKLGNSLVHELTRLAHLLLLAPQSRGQSRSKSSETDVTIPKD